MLMWNAWRWMRGTVRCRAEGGLCERFLSLLGEMTPPMSVWDIRRENGAVTLCCRAKDYARMRTPARRTGTRLRAQQKSGLPFLTKPLFRRTGLFVGAALAVLLYMLLGNRIWIMDIETDDPAIATHIEEQLARNGVYVGARIRDVDVPSVRMHAIAEIKEINQLSLYFDGSIAHVGVQLQKQSAAPPDTSPANIIAAADGRIVTMRATIGNPLVMEGEAVVKGDLLVCGAVETENGTLFRHASAVIYAETTHCFEQTVRQTELVPCKGRVVEQPSIRILAWHIPLYSDTSFDQSWTVTTHERLLSLFGTTLPVGIVSTLYTEQQQTPITYTREQTEALAKERLQAHAQTELADARIDNVTFDGQWDGDSYRLRAVYECTENIAKEVPIIIQ